MALAKAIAILYSRKLSRNGEKYNFRCGENFRGLLTFAVPKDATPQNFVEKTCVNSHKTTKFAKVFSLKSFPLYGVVIQIALSCYFLVVLMQLLLSWTPVWV